MNNVILIVIENKKMFYCIKFILFLENFIQNYYLFDFIAMACHEYVFKFQLIL